MELTGNDTRWLVRRDMDQVLEIERLSFPHPWSEEEFLAALRQGNCIGRVRHGPRCI